MNLHHHSIGHRMTGLAAGVAVMFFSSSDSSGFAGGDGSLTTPYQVASAEHLDAVRDHLAAHFVQTGHIDLGVAPWNAGWEPIGTAATPFSGSFDGGSFTITGLAIHRPADDNVGLFGRATHESSLRAIRLVGVNVTGSNAVGALAGVAGSVVDCHASGTVTGGGQVGGLVGTASGIGDSSAAVAVTGTFQVGGLAGNGSGITGSKATGTVTGGDEVGGLLGAQTWILEVTDSYATGAVSGGNRVAGLIGYNDRVAPRRCYASGTVSASGLSGGLGSWVMYRSHACFWDIESSGAPGSSGGKGLTTAQMGTPSIFGNAGWGGHGWVMNPGEPPRREWEGTGAPPVPAAVPVPLAGMGTEAQPYQVGSAADLASLSWHVAVLDAHLSITTDIDCEGVTLHPLGDLGPFTGVFDGGGHVISSATIEYPESDSVGLVASLGEGGLVKNVHMEGASVSGRHNTGALVGDMLGRYEAMPEHLEWYPARVEHSSASGQVAGNVITGGLVGAVHTSEVADSTSSVVVNGEFSVGGIAGYVVVGSLERCTSNGQVTGIDKVGGIAGSLLGVDVYMHIPGMSHKLGKIVSCHSTSVVTGQDEVGGLLGEQWGSGGAEGGGPGVSGSRSDGPVGGRDRVGGLIGFNRDYSPVIDCVSTGPVQGNDHVGGLVGRQEVGGSILRCFSLAEIDGRNALGGLVGSQHASQVHQSFARGQVTSSGTNAGGLVGDNQGSSLVSNCYAMGRIHGGFAGGLVGMNVASTIEHCHSNGMVTGFTAIGGLVGYQVSASTDASYWDTVASGRPTSAGGLPRTTGDMTHPHDPDTYVDWNFSGIWSADADGTRNHGYPYLADVTPPPATIHVVADPASGGSATGGGIHPIGSRATLVAAPAPHHHFLGWEEDGKVVSTQASHLFTVTGERELTARFALDSYAIAITAMPEALGSVAGGGEFGHGSLVTVTATPGPDGRFLHWMENDAVVSTDEVYEFTAEGPRVLVAHFGMQVVFGGGTGSASDPYLVASPLHLHSVREVPDAHFRQTEDIDLGTAPWNHWEPIGRPANPLDYEPHEVFSGHYDGGGFAIRNLTIDRPADSILGLFGVMSGGEITGVVIENANVSGEGDVGTLVAWMSGGRISHCHASGSVRAEWNGAGGLVANLESGEIEYASSAVEVIGRGICGGLVGGSGGTIRRSFATGPVTGGWYAGGFVGRTWFGLIEDCYARGSVTDPDEFGPIGGFAGGERWLDSEITIRNCYSTGLVSGGDGETGGFIGVWGDDWEDPDMPNVAVLEGCYWDTETSGLAESAAGDGRTTTQMTHPHDPTTYFGWDFDAIWAADTDGNLNNGYPYLRAPDEEPPPTGELLANPSFDEEMGAAWQVADEDDRAWIFATPGEADLHAAGFIGRVVWQDLDLAVAGGAAFDVSMRLSRGHAPEGASTEVRLDYEDGAGQRHSLLVLAPDNDDVAFYPDSTLFTGRATLPGDAVKLLAFGVHRAGPGMFFAIEFSLMAAEASGGPFTLVYHAGPGGSLVGPSPQTVAAGDPGSTMFAIPDAGAVFHQWSDGSNANPRVEENVQANLEVTARFRSAGGVDIDWFAGHGIAPGEGQTWADLDGIDWLGKGMTLSQEFIAGTDPNDPRSRFFCEPPQLFFNPYLQSSFPEGVLLRWSSVAGRMYLIEFSTDLETWSPLLNYAANPLLLPASEEGETTEWIFPPPLVQEGSPLFFRILVIPPD